jgi:hypothetical protein
MQLSIRHRCGARNPPSGGIVDESAPASAACIAPRAPERSQRALEIAGGIVLILSGLYMLNAYLLLIPKLAV